MVSDSLMGVGMGPSQATVLILLLMEYGLGHIVAIQIGGICHEPS